MLSRTNKVSHELIKLATTSLGSALAAEFQMNARASASLPMQQLMLRGDQTATLNMHSQASSPTLPQLRKLHFFPASFPDETLFSRVSRYHLLTGDRRHDTTFHALFGRVNSLDFTELAPPSLSVLASLLPGDPVVQLGNLLVENTFVPFAKPKVA